MSCLKYIALCSVIVAASLKSTHAVTDEEKGNFYKLMIPAIAECGPKFGTDHDSLKEAKEKGELDGINPCFFACMFKHTGFMNDEGNFDMELSIKKTKEILKSEEDIAKVEVVAKECSSVNDEPVKDGAEGCERAQLLFKCLRQHKNQFAL